MKNRQITLLGPQGTNLFIFLIFLIFIFISWFTLYTLTDFEGLDFDVNNILTRQVVFSIGSVVVFFLLTYLSIENLQNYSNILFFLAFSSRLLTDLAWRSRCTTPMFASRGSRCTPSGASGRRSRSHGSGSRAACA